jgi:predicted exporter
VLRRVVACLMYVPLAGAIWSGYELLAPDDENRTYYRIVLALSTLAFLLMLQTFFRPSSTLPYSEGRKERSRILTPAIAAFMVAAAVFLRLHHSVLNAILAGALVLVLGTAVNYALFKAQARRGSEQR